MPSADPKLGAGAVVWAEIACPLSGYRWRCALWGRISSWIERNHAALAVYRSRHLVLFFGGFASVDRLGLSTALKEANVSDGSHCSRPGVIGHCLYLPDRMVKHRFEIQLCEGRALNVSVGLDFGGALGAHLVRDRGHAVER